MRKFLTLLVLILVVCPSYALAEGNTTNDSFSRAKRLLEREVYFDHQITIYCEAEYENKEIHLKDGFYTPKHEKRAQRLEWEHAVPAENFGRAFPEWREGHPECVNNKGKAFKGRRCAEKVNHDYRHMQADMYNLFPSIGAVNAMRGNKRYSELPDMEPTFGSCQAKVDEEGNRFEPPNSAKGEVARAALYMADVYPDYNLSRQQQRLFEAWDRQYPVTEWECLRAARIEALQGNANDRVKKHCP